MITIEEVKNSHVIKTYIEKADESLRALGYTEHSYAHVNKVSQSAGHILRTLGYPERDCELAEIAGYLHDIGNVINRIDHAQSGAVMAFRILDNMAASPEDIATVITAIGNHDEATAHPVSPIAAALILADKSDVRRSRVRNKDIATFDIHDRVNYSVVKSELRIKDKKNSEEKQLIELKIQIDTQVCSVMNYFEIFLNRMLLCRKAAESINLEFTLVVNGQRML
ncbi:MAG: HD domain-containing protein [Acutalibacteraceae bacterium]|nr:HD domain-containing protein [Acutalibacteraceae bacterium]